MSYSLTLTNGTTTVSIPIKYDGLDYSSNKIWSSDTGRNNYGTMQGTLLAVKKKITAALPPITPSKVTEIENLLSDTDNAWLTCSYTFGSITGSFTAYTGDCSFHWLSSVLGSSGNGLITDSTISIIEK